MLAKLLEVFGFVRFVLRRWREDRCPQIAGSLTYTTLLAITPLFAIAVAFLSSAPFFHEVMAKIKIFLLLNLAPEVAQTMITVYMPQIAHNARRLTWVGLGTILVVAVWLMLIIDRSLNVIWRVHAERPYWMSVAGYVALIVAWPILLGVSVSATTYLVALSSHIGGLPEVVHVPMLRAVPVAMSALAFFLLYRIIPHGHVPWRHAALGGLVAAALFETAKELFAFYVRASPTYSVVYGAFAAIPVFLVWIYISWLVILFGAELTAAAAYWRNGTWRRPSGAAAHFREALALMQVLLETGKATPGRLRERTGLSDARIQEALHYMIDAGVVERTSRASYALTPDARETLAISAADAALDESSAPAKP
ncbi:MAG: YihY family inner membrane protein [Usitatibacter sp.]